MMRIFVLLAILLSCAGPTNPFGGNVFISEEFSIDKMYAGQDIKLNFSPGAQYFNSPYDLKITLTDPNYKINDFRYEIIYNNQKLDRWYKSEEIKFPKNKTKPIEITFKNLSILPGHINKIGFVYYPSASAHPVIHNLEIPHCIKNSKGNNLSINQFKVSSALTADIKDLAKEYNYNPSLVAALIAQESSFRPKTLSYAKALGLTQITTTAHREIKRFKKDWKIYPGFSKTSVRNLNKKISNNQINAKNDWRLEPKKSIEGGIIYLDYFKSYWATPDKRDILSQAFKKKIPEIDILLASYNSGASRVKQAIINSKVNWLFDKTLNEARKYVMNIKSYCYSFNQGKSHAK